MDEDDISHTMQGSLGKASTIRSCVSLPRTATASLAIPFEQSFTAVEDYGNDPEKGVYIPASSVKCKAGHPKVINPPHVQNVGCLCRLW